MDTWPKGRGIADQDAKLQTRALGRDLGHGAADRLDFLASLVPAEMLGHLPSVIQRGGSTSMT